MRVIKLEINRHRQDTNRAKLRITGMKELIQSMNSPTISLTGLRSKIVS